ncbi:MAG TPA: helix-turn-helix domain-containing protein [Thermoleophilaceae bacterium]|jgi:transcriptional regulator with XRE-family HTH domain|nr:helix-turn-helix domain-containing protein [Thermoleophilaceae bacterium]
MPTIGETLREARMRQRLDIADVEERTKIRAKYLRALENEEFGMLPGPTFVKTFLRTYSEVLGLDPQLLLEEYRLRYETGDEVEHIQSLGPPNLARDRRRGGPRLGPGSLLLLVLLVVVGALVAIGLLSEDGDEGGGDQAADTATQTTTTPARRRRERPVPRRVVLRIAPITPTYVCVDRGPGTEVIFENTIDSPQTFRGRRLRVNFGKTDVEVVKNGRPVPIEPSAEPIGLNFTVRGTRPIPSGERPCA